MDVLSLSMLYILLSMYVYNHLIIIYIHATVYWRLLGSQLDVVIHCVAFIDFATCQFLVAAVRNLSLLIRCEKEKKREGEAYRFV